MQLGTAGLVPGLYACCLAAGFLHHPAQAFPGGPRLHPNCPANPPCLFVPQLLASSTISDVQESIAMLLTCKQFEVDGAGATIRKMLPLIFAKDQGGRPGSGRSGGIQDRPLYVMCRQGMRTAGSNPAHCCLPRL